MKNVICVACCVLCCVNQDALSASKSTTKTRKVAKKTKKRPVKSTQTAKRQQNKQAAIQNQGAMMATNEPLYVPQQPPQQIIYPQSMQMPQQYPVYNMNNYPVQQQNNQFYNNRPMMNGRNLYGENQYRYQPQQYQNPQNRYNSNVHAAQSNMYAYSNYRQPQPIVNMPVNSNQYTMRGNMMNQAVNVNRAQADYPRANVVETAQVIEPPKNQQNVVETKRIPVEEDDSWKDIVAETNAQGEVDNPAVNSWLASVKNMPLPQKKNKHFHFGRNKDVRADANADNASQLRQELAQYRTGGLV